MKAKLLGVSRQYLIWALLLLLIVTSGGTPVFQTVWPAKSYQKGQIIPIPRTNGVPRLAPQAFEAIARGNRNPDRVLGIKGGRVEREDWYRHMRTYPETSIPFQARQRAYDLLQTQTNRLAPAALNTWQDVGPAPIVGENLGQYRLAASGRTTAVLVHPQNPNIIYIGGAQGGVWKTTDAGSTWTPLTDNQPSLAIGTMTFDPTNPNVIYVGTGEPHSSGDSYYGAGILKTTDGGATWTQLGASKFAGMGIANIVVDPVDPNKLYVAASTSVIGNKPVADLPGVYRSMDGGATWTRIGSSCSNQNDPSTCASPAALVIHPATPSVLYAAFDQLGVYRYDGTTWTLKLGPNSPAVQANFSRAEVAISPSNGLVLYAGLEIAVQNGTVGILFKSMDGGDNWTYLNSLQVSYCGQQCGYDNIIVVHPTNPNFVLAGGAALYSNNVSGIDGTVFKTTDGGSSWAPNAGTSADTTIHPDLHAIAFDPSPLHTIWIGNDGGVYRSMDAGATWENRNGNLGTLQFQSVSLHPTDQNVFFGGMQDNAKAKTTNGGANWEGLDAGDGGFTVFDPFDPTIWYGSRYSSKGSVMQFQRNDYNGSSPFSQWPLKNSGIDVNDRVMFYAPLAADPNAQGRVYWGTDRLYRSNDRGESWTAISGNLTKNQNYFSAISNFAIASGNSNIILVGTADGKVQLTTNGGTNWTDITKSPLPNRFVSDVAIQNAQTMYVAYNGFNANTPTTPGHVFKTTNAGTTWTDISRTGDANGLPDLPVLTIALDRDTEDIYLGTDLGVYRSIDGGSSWSPFNQGLPKVAVYDLALQKYADGSKFLAAGTHGRSIWRVSLVPTNLTNKVFLPAVLKNYGVSQALPTVKNGNFELGRNGDWTESSTGGWPLVVNSGFQTTPRSGQYVAWLGGADNETGDLSQSFTLPAGSAIYLHFYYRLGSQETSCTHDFARVLVNTTAVWVKGLCQSNNTSGWTKGSLDLSSYGGQAITVHFRAETDNSVNSNFFIDDVSFQSTP